MPAYTKPQGYRLIKDGTAWCATPPGFIDLQSSPAGFGDTQEQAVKALIADQQFQIWLLRRNMRTPTMADFTVEPHNA